MPKINTIFKVFNYIADSDDNNPFKNEDLISYDY